ncbi:hypothetical protein ACFOWZ_11520 [Lentzea rhizosphaerae]|uniref:Uncharacterized protein n=1 Tax=Lentzea rhizosphaerae TaxID=2041025 RepID=A0ABV8BQ44_9PSEU
MNQQTRRTLRQMTVPAAIAYVVITVLTLLARVIGLVAALIADVTERLADAGDTACAVARGPVLVTTTGPAGGAA